MAAPKDPASREPLDPQFQSDSFDPDGDAATAPANPDDAEAAFVADAALDDAGESVAEDLAGMLADAQEQLSRYHDELLRAKAEVENIRRRAQEDVSKARKFGTESFAESLVPVKDSLEAALAQPDQTPDTWKQGVEITLKQLSAAFERNQLKEVAPQPGDRFDPNVHQAISSIPSEHAEGGVVQCLQKGYTIAERVLRPALVTVSSGPSQA